ncbi:hypothetical protein CFAM422_007378 [Trichoderma lentiforme]|uniref:Uncharacterized protein n=1 Tax=Trichoderma lentiforme TaxID=1567552 RepID=A0A9P5CCI1_9HYPO|nr:hypothetical protein CFAM422_007378 [Trichoderma lentiforme]
MTDPVAHGMPWSVIPVLRNVEAAVQFRATGMLCIWKNLFVSVYSGYAEWTGDGKLSSSSGSVWLRDDEFCLVDGMRGNCIGE